MRILITGASGFVGKAFVRQAVNMYDEIFSLGRTNTNEASRHITTDITNATAVKHAIASIDGDVDVLLHLAAFVPKNAAEDEIGEAERVNIHGLVNILDALQGRIKRVVLGSTIEVYNHAEIKGPVAAESAQVGPLSYYAATKLGSEYIASSYSKKNKVPLTILRFSVMYGPADPIERALPNFIRSALVGEDIVIPSGAEALRDYVHVEDVVASINTAISSAASGTIDIGSGQGVTIRQAAEDIIRSIGSESSVIMKGNAQGVDIVVNPEPAKKLIGYEAKIKFPEKLDEMIASFK